MALLLGDGQIGKSKNLEEYARTTENLQGAARMASAERVVVTWTHFLRTIKAFGGQEGVPA